MTIKTVKTEVKHPDPQTTIDGMTQMLKEMFPTATVLTKTYFVGEHTEYIISLVLTKRV